MVVTLTVLARINGPGNTPLTRVALQNVRNVSRGQKPSSRSVVPIWGNEIVRNVELGHRTKYICWRCIRVQKLWERQRIREV
jgi:hypothetical protein